MWPLIEERVCWLVKRAGSAELEPGNPLWMTMLERLRQGLSPVQIASTLARMAEVRSHLFHEAIYTALYAMPRGRFPRQPAGSVAPQTQGSQTGARYKSSAVSPIPDMTLIDQRPVEVAHATGSRALGRRPSHSRGKPLSGRHSGGAHNPSLSPW